MYSYNSTVEKNCKDLVSNNQIIFCGAGISYDSGVPLVYEIITSILEHLECKKEHIERILNANIPFESFFETLIDNTEGEKLFPIFEIGEPNTNHYFIANLAKENVISTVVTTNFDKLIEKACDECSIEYELIYREQQFNAIDWNNKKFKIIKLHGSIDNKQRMAITIRDVASNKLVKERQSVLKYIFSNGDHNSVMMLGYSCSDIFDIVPTIESFKKCKNIFFVEHNHLLKTNEVTIEHVSNKNTNNPFNKYQGIRYHVDTSSLIEDLWENILRTKYEVHTHEKQQWKYILNEWIAIEEKYKKDYSLAHILYATSNYKEAIVYFEKSLEHALNFDIAINIAYSSHNLARSFHRSGDYEQAIKFGKKALDIFSVIEIPLKIIHQLNDLGLAYRRFNDPTNARKYHIKSLWLSRNLKRKETKWAALGNLAIIYKNQNKLKKSMRYSSLALNLARKEGQVKGIINHLGNLGIIHRKQNLLTKAKEFHLEALALSKSIVDRQGEANQEGNLALIYIEEKLYSKAEAKLIIATKIFKEINDKGGYNNCFNELSALQDKAQKSLTKV